MVSPRVLLLFLTNSSSFWLWRFFFDMVFNTCHSSINLNTTAGLANYDFFRLSNIRLQLRRNFCKTSTTCTSQYRCYSNSISKIVSNAVICLKQFSINCFGRFLSLFVYLNFFFLGFFNNLFKLRFLSLKIFFSFIQI